MLIRAPLTLLMLFLHVQYQWNPLENMTCWEINIRWAGGR